MSKVTFSARSAKGRVRTMSARPRLEQDEFRVAFADARPQRHRQILVQDRPERLPEELADQEAQKQSEVDCGERGNLFILRGKIDGDNEDAQ